MTILFYFFSLLSLLSAAGLLFIRNVFRAAILLLVCLLSLAGIFVLTFAEFVAVVQILIYAGGVLVLIIFGIMLTSKISGKPLMVAHAKWFEGLLTGCGILFILVYFFSDEFPGQTSGQSILEQHEPISAIGINLMTDYLLPFELSGILLLIALTGAAILASSGTKENIS